MYRRLLSHHLNFLGPQKGGTTPPSSPIPSSLSTPSTSSLPLSLNTSSKPTKSALRRARKKRQVKAALSLDTSLESTSISTISDVTPLKSLNYAPTEVEDEDENDYSGFDEIKSKFSSFKMLLVFPFLDINTNFDHLVGLILSDNYFKDSDAASEGQFCFLFLRITKFDARENFLFSRFFFLLLPIIVYLTFSIYIIYRYYSINNIRSS